MATSCTSCFDICTPGVTSDRCVKYTGDDISELEIVQGMSLKDVEAIIFAKLLSHDDGSSITLPNNTIGCTFLTGLLAGKSKTLQNIVQMLTDGECALKTSVAAIESQLATSVSFDTECLGISTSSNRDQVLQGTITKLCTVADDVATLQDTYVKTTDVCTLVKQCIAASASIQEYTKLLKYVAYPYHGPLSVFDSAGKGLSSAGYDKIYLCIGQTVNGFVLPDYRGRSPVGANTNVPTGGMDSVVNPGLPANAAYGMGVNTKKGEYSHTLSIPEIASHNHSVGGQTFNVNVPGQRGGDNDDHNNMTAFSFGDKNASETSFNGTLSVSVAVPSSTTSNTGSNQSHNNLAPVVGANFIMYVP